MSNITDTERIAITAAAVQAAGPRNLYLMEVEVPDTSEGAAPGSTKRIQMPDPAAWQAAVHENAVEIAVMSTEKGLVGVAIEQLLGPNTKVFSGTVIAAKKEPRSTRVIVTLHTGTDRQNADAITKAPLPAGCEQVRTERTDNPIGLQVARKARDLIGHKVLVRVELEEVNNGQTKVRVLRHIQSLGLDPEAQNKGIGQV